MFGLYDHSLEKFKQNLRDRVPIILALFTGQGGQMILYRPGHAPEVAPPVPIVYQLAKSVGHSTMAIYQIVVPYLSNPAANQLWRAPLQAYRTQNQTALDSLSRPGHFRRRPSRAPHHSRTQPGLYGRMSHERNI